MVSVAADKTVREEATKRLISKLKAHIIVYGYDHMGKYVTDKLEEAGYDYVVISRNAEICQELLKNKIFALTESKTDPLGALKSAGIDKASMIIVTDVNDSDNIRFILTARKLRPDVRIHTVINDPSLAETAKDAGANLVIPPSVTVGHLLAFSAGTKELIGVIFSKKMETQSITEYNIQKSSPLIGRKLQEMARMVGITGVLRGGKVDDTVFGGNFTLKEGDTLIIIGDTSKLEAFEKKHAA